MWLVVITLAAVIVTAIWYTSDKARQTYRIGLLNLILWGTSIMVLVDYILGWHAEGGEFLEVTPEALMLSVVLIITALMAWEAVLLFKDPKGLLRT